MNRHVELLWRYNEWRRGDGDIKDMPASAKEISEAIDAVIWEHYELLEALDEVTEFWYAGAEAPSAEELEPYIKIIDKAKGEQ